MGKNVVGEGERSGFRGEGRVGAEAVVDHGFGAEAGIWINRRRMVRV